LNAAARIDDAPGQFDQEEDEGQPEGDLQRLLARARSVVMARVTAGAAMSMVMLGV
jgi:hypothetical protein